MSCANSKEEVRKLGARRRRGPWAGGLPAALLLCLALAAGAHAAGRKSAGGTVVVDDLATGSAGSVGMAGGVYELDGTLGQVSVLETSAAGSDAEAGYFSKLTTSPANPAYAAAHVSSASANWAEPSPANPAGTLYAFELSTASDFTGQVFSSSTYLLTSTITALAPDTVYYGRIKASYMEGDDTPYTLLGSTRTRCGSLTSAGDGPWSAPATWGGSVPTGCGSVTIAAGHTVTVDTTTATASTTTLYGTLAFSRVVNSSLTMVGGDITVEPGGYLDMGTSGQPINVSSATLVLASGTVAGQYGLIVKDGGDFTVYGAAKNPIAVMPTTFINSFTNNFSISASSSSGWEAGDVITIGPTPGSSGNTTLHTITNFTGGPDPRNVWFTPDTGIDIRGASPTTPLIIANLSRSVVIRSSGTDTNANTAYVHGLVTNTTSFNVAYGEFAFLGANAAPKYGVSIMSGGTRASISSSSFYSGYYGIRTGSVDNSTFTGNVAYGNAAFGFVFGGDDNRYRRNLAAENGGTGLYIDNGSAGSLLTDNYSCSNGGNGFAFAPGVTGGISRGNLAFFNAADGFNLDAAARNTFESNSSYLNSFHGFRLANGTMLNTFLNNSMHDSQGGDGIILSDSWANVLVGNDIFNNPVNGIYITASSGTVMSSNTIYSNTNYGIALHDSLDNIFIGGAIGLDNIGNPALNTAGPLDIDIDANPESLIVKGVATADVAMDTAGFNTTGAYMISYELYDSSTSASVFGDYLLSGGTWTFAYNELVYVSTATRPKLMRGSGHGAVVCTTVDGAAVTQMIVAEYNGFNWSVSGSESGGMGSIFAGSCADPGGAGQFTMNITESSPQPGDRIDFLLQADSKDAGKDKQLLFGPSAAAFRQGRSRLTVAPDAGIVFRGRPGKYAVIDRLDWNATYYSFVSSGAFTASFTSFTNIGYDGLWLSGDKGVSISTSVFDYLGFSGGTNTYITMRGLTSPATFYDVSFKASRAKPPDPVAAYNVRVESPDGNLDVYFVSEASYTGVIWGEDFDDDANGRVNWVNKFLPLALSTPSYPGNGTYVSTPAPNFAWYGPSTTAAVGLGSGASYYLEVDDDSGFTTPLTISISTQIVVQSTMTAFDDAVYVSTFALAEGTTYWWRVRAWDGVSTQYGPSSEVFSFVTDFTAPADSAFASISSTAGVMGEGQTVDLTAGVTVQMKVQDVLAGLLNSTSTLPGNLPLAPGGFGVMYSTDAGKSWSGASTRVSRDGAGERIWPLISYRGRLYAGQGSQVNLGDGDVFVYDGAFWSTSFDGATKSVDSFAAYKGKLYAGFGADNGSADVRVCDPAGGADPELCENGDWSLSYDGPASNIWAMAVYNGKLYAAQGSCAGCGDILVFDGTNWSISYDGSTPVFISLAVYDGKLYAGQGNGAGNGDVLVYDGSAWSVSYNGAQEKIGALAVYDGKLYAGQGSNNGDGDILSFDGTNWSVAFDGSNGTIDGLTVFNGVLYAGGQVVSGQGNVYAYNGSTWTVVESGSYSNIYNLAAYNGRLFFGQGFDTAGEGDVFEMVPASSSLTGVDGSQSQENLTAVVDLALSTNTETCGGVSPCGATNQVVFTVTDRAGNVRYAGPYAVQTTACGPIASVKTGDWSDPFTWDRRMAPSDCSYPTITSPHVVTVDTTTATSSSMTVAGTLYFDRIFKSTLTMVEGDITVVSGGHLDMGTGGDEIVLGTATLVLAMGTTAGEHGLIVQNGGRFTVFGATKSPFGYSSTDIPAATNSFEIAASSSIGWKAGDVITLGPTSGSGPASVWVATITSVGGGDPKLVNFMFMPTQSRVATATAPIVVANLSRNVVIRSSGTDTAANTAYIRNLSQAAGDFYSYYGEFAHLGANSSGKYGVTFDGAGTRGSISSSTVRNGYHGIYLNASSNNTLTSNNSYSNLNHAIIIGNSSNNTLTSNNSYSNSGNGILLTNSSNNTLTSNNSYSNSSCDIYLAASSNNTLTSNNSYSSNIGIYLTNSSNNTLTSNNSYSNSSYGIWLNGSSNNALNSNRSYLNSLHGFYLSAASNNTLTGDVAYSNTQDGYYIDGSVDNLFVGDRSYSNGRYGKYLIGSTGSTMIGNYIYGNADRGLLLDNSSGNTFVDGAMGYDADGAGLPNGAPEIDFWSGPQPENLVLKNSRVNPVSAGSNSGLNIPGNFILSYGQDFATGTLRLYGDYTLSGSTWTFDTGYALYTSTATAPKLMRGAGHGVSISTTHDSGAVSQLISFVYDAGGPAWRIEGSSTGLIATLPAGSFADQAIGTPAQFSAALTQGGTPLDGDRVDFALIAASNDAGFQKRLLFEDANPAFNNGKSKLTVAPDGGIVFAGQPGAHAIVDRLNTSSTYYSFVSSGAFTARFSSFTNMDGGGIQLSGDKGVAISSAVFDYLGFATATNAYITARDLTSDVTIDSVTFGAGRAAPGGSNAFYNVRVVNGANLYWRFTTENLGARWGEDYDDDAGRRVSWYRCGPMVSYQDGSWSDPLTWDTEFTPTVCNMPIIAQGHTVTVDSMDAVSGMLDIWGRLTFDRVVSSSLTVAGGNVTVSPGGWLDLGSEASPIPAGMDAHLVLAHGASAGQYGLIVNDGADFTVRGATKSPYGFATTSLGAGAPSLTVPALEADGWEVGDRITVGPTSGSGNGFTEEFTIAAIAGGDVTLSGTIAAARSRTSTTPVVVANLTRNVLVRSSGTNTAANSAYIQNLVKNTTSFSLNYGEFAYLGANAAGKQGIRFESSGVEGRVSSSTVRDGYYGVMVNVGGTHEFAYNNLYNNAQWGFYAADMRGSTVAFNTFAENAQDGLYLGDSAAGGDLVRGNYSYANGGDGVTLELGRGRRITGNYAFCNADVGIRFNSVYDSGFTSNTAHGNAAQGFYLLGSASNTLTGNIAYINNAAGFFLGSDANRNVLQGNAAQGNSNTGFYLGGAGGNTLIGNESSGNTGPSGYGLSFASSDDNSLSGNRIFNNALDGVRLVNSDKNRFTGEHIYGNGQTGVFYSGVNEAEFADSFFGYAPDGSDLPNAGAQLRGDPLSPPGNRLLLRGSSVNPNAGIALDGFNGTDKLLASWNQNSDTGTLRLWGDLSIDDGLSLVYADDLLGATTANLNLMRGTGHGAVLCSINSAEAVSQVVSILYAGGAWEVRGSSSGLMEANLQSNPCGVGDDIPATNTQFNIEFSPGGSPQEGDRLDFMLLAGTQDPNTQKKLLIGPAHSSFNGGRSKVVFTQASTFTLTGQAGGGNPSILDRLDGGSTYFSLVSSGVFTAVNSSISNTDKDGLWLGGGQKITIATTTFDNMGVMAPDNAYISLDSVVGTADFYNVGFLNSRSTAGVTANNVRVVTGPDPNWTFHRWHGDLGGEDYDQDTNGISWTGYMPSSPTAPAAVQTGSTAALTFQWDASYIDGPAIGLAAGSRYYVQWSTGAPAAVDWSTANAQVNAATGPVAAGLRVGHTFTGLPGGKTVYFRAWSQDEFGRVSRPSDLAGEFSPPFSYAVLAAGLNANSQEHDMAVDKDGNVHLVYDDYNANQVKYLKRTGGNWAGPVVVGGETAGTGSLPSIAVDIFGNPHVVWNSNTGQMNYSSSTDQGASFLASEIVYANDTHHDLAIDGLGEPHIAFFSDEGVDALRYIRRSSGAWSAIEIVDSGGTILGSYLSLALDGAGRPHAVYAQDAPYLLKYASRTLNGWNPVTLYTDSNLPNTADLVIAGDGRPRVAYAANDTTSLLYMTYDGSSWNSETVDDGLAFPQHPTALALDGAGNAHISYRRSGTDDLKYAYYDGASWSTMTVASDGDAGMLSIIALDDTGSVNISYLLNPGGDRDLYFASWTATGFAPPMGGNPRGKVQAPTLFGAGGVYTTSATWSWNDNAANEHGYRIYQSSFNRADIAFDIAVDSDTLPAGSVSYTHNGLTPNTTYLAYVAAVNNGGAVTSSGARINTWAEPPGVPAVPVAAAWYTSMSVSWLTGGNPSYTEYFVRAATSTDFGGTVFYPAGGAGWIVDSSTELVAMAELNTTHYIQVKARNIDGIETPYVLLGATPTLAGTPVTTGDDFVTVSSYSAAVTWSGAGNPADTLYIVKLATASPFTSSVSVTTAPSGALSAGLTGLTGNTTYYLAVTAISRAGIGTPNPILGSTITLIAPPTDIYFDRITTGTIVASAYAPTPAFNNLHAGRSATAIEKDGVGGFVNWRGSSWTVKTAMTGAGRSGLAAAALGGYVYVAGGYNATPLGTLQRYNPATNGWATLNAMTPREKLGLTAVGGKLYAIGGYDNGSYLRLVESYDPDTGLWDTPLAVMPSFRESPHVGSFAGKIYAIGGKFGGSVQSTNHEYDPQENLWGSDKAVMPTPRAYGAAVSMDGLIFVIGGRAGVGTALAGVEAFNPNTNGWNTLTAMPTARRAVAAAGVGGKIYVFGGELAGGTLLALNEEYDVRADAWAERIPMSTARSFAAAAAHNGKIYVVGGTDGAPMNVVEEFDPGVAQVFTGLIPNTQYSFRAKARNSVGTETSATGFISTYTLAAVPGTASPTFLAVTPASVTFQWTANSNPGGITPYRAEASTAADFSGTLSVKDWTIDLFSTTLESLGGNTTYYFRVQARNFDGVETAFTGLGSTVTAANIPSAPFAAQVAKSSVVFQWSKNGNSDGTDYYAELGDNENFSALVVSSFTKDNRAVFGATGEGAPLALNTTYYFRVQAVNVGGAPTVFTSTLAARTLVETPGVAGLPFPSLDIDFMEFEWTRGGNPDGTIYEAQVSTDDFATVNLASTTRSTSTLFGAGGEGLALLRNATHYFRVRALNSSGDPTDYVPTQSKPTLAAAPVAAAPEFLSVDLTSAAYQWAVNQNEPGTLYEFRLSTDAFATVNFSSFTYETSVLSGNGGEGEDLRQNTTYYFLVRAVNHEGVVSGLIQTSTHTRAAVPVFAPFTNVEIGSITVNWTANNNPAATRYYVTASTDQFSTLNFVSSTTATALQAGDGGIGVTLDVNTTYYFTLRAQDVGGTLTDFPAPRSTATLAVVPGAGSFSDVGLSSAVFAWTSADPPGTLYETQLSTNGFSTVNLTSATRAQAAVFGTTGEGQPLDPSATYYFRVRALNHNGIPTGYLQAVTTHTLAAAPASAAATFTDVYRSSMTAAWDANGNGPGTVYEAVLSTQTPWVATHAGNVPVSTHPAGTPSADFTGLVANTTYYLFVRAVNADNWRSDYTALGSTPTWPNPPTAYVPAFPDIHESSATVQWDHNGNAVGVSIYRVLLSTENFYPNASAGNQEISTAPASAVAAATLTGLVSNATYYLHAAIYSHSGSLTSYTMLGTGQTRAREPATAVSTFSNVTATGLTGAWENNGNGDGTVYEASVSTGSGLPSAYAGDVPVSTAPSGAPSAGFAGLVPNTTYYLIVRTVARDGTPTPYVLLGSTTTPADLPVAASPAFSSGSTTGLVGDWGANGNPPDVTVYETVLSTETPLDLGSAGNVPVSTAPSGAPSAEYTSLAVNTTYYLFVRAVDRLGRPTAYVEVGSSATLASVPSTVLVSTPFSQVDFNAVHYTWDPNGNPPGTVYEAQISSDGFSTVNLTSVTFSTTAIFGELGVGGILGPETTYYFQVRARSVRGEPTAYTTIQSTATLADDRVSPTLTVNQTGDIRWRKNSSTAYDVDVFDAGGKHLDRIEVSASLGPGGGADLFGFTPVVTNLAGFGDAFTNDWTLSPVFSQLADGVTNYITVRVYDGAGGGGNFVTAVDAFYVLKDTSPPVLTNGEAGGDDAPRDAAGTAYDVDAADAASGLAGFQYSASTAALSADEGRVPWTDIPALVPGMFAYTTDWTVDFASLQEGTTNYVSVRSWNVAGATSTIVDAFHVIKDTSGPIVEITLPASGFVSALATISGTAADLLGVRGSEVNIKEVGGNYWDPAGPAFSAGAPIWMPASGQNNWTLSPAIPWVNGQEYQIVARSSDNAGNYTVTYETATFTFDASTPTYSVAAPAPDSTISSLPLITGTAADPGAAPSGLQSVGIRLRNLADGLWWDFVNEVWSGMPVTEIASGLNSWTVTPSELLKANLKDETSYFIAVQAADSAAPANQTEFLVGGATFTFSDTTPPAAITDLTGAAGAEPGDILLSWTAPGDDAGAGMVLLGEYRIHFSTDPAVALSTADAQVVFSTTTVAPGEDQGRLLVGLAEGLSPETSYYLAVFLQDDAGNWSPLSNAATVYSAPSPYSQIKGHVMTLSSQGITAVALAAYDGAGVLVSTGLSVADGSGTWVLGGIPSGDFRIEAVWEVNEIISSVWLDGIPVGATQIDFVLEIDYTLSTVQGTLQSLAGGLGSSGFAAAAAENNFGGSRVEMLQRGGVVAQTAVEPTGRWRIVNLLPGKYFVRAFNGLEYTKTKEVTLLEGEIQDVSFVFDPLNEDSVFAFPNPAKDDVTFRFVSALFPIEAQIRVFDIAGTLVREITGSQMESPSAGLYHAKWDLKNTNGEDVASGVYLFIVKVKGANGQSAKVIKKAAVVR